MNIEQIEKPNKIIAQDDFGPLLSLLEQLNESACYYKTMLQQK